MSGYQATSASTLSIALGQQTLITQSALAYAPGQVVGLTYQQDATIYMQGPVVAYNAVTGVMIVDVTYTTGVSAIAMNPVWNTRPWGSTGVASLAGWNLTLVSGASPATTATPTIWVRTLDTNWDPQGGAGMKNFLTDIDAVAQIIAQRIKLLEGEWFEDQTLGTPLFQSMLGVPQTVDGIALLLRRRILSCPYVTGITAFNAAYFSGRAFTFTAQVQTAFGEIAVTNATA